MKTIEIEKDVDIIIVDGMKFSRELLAVIAGPLYVGKVFRIVKNVDGVATVQEVRK